MQGQDGRDMGALRGQQVRLKFYITDVTHGASPTVDSLDSRVRGNDDRPTAGSDRRYIRLSNVSYIINATLYSF